MEELLTTNRIWKQRLINVGVLSRNTAFNLSFTGVLLRSTGVMWDLRKNLPYEVYSKVNFNVPIGNVGDCFDRYLLRLEEMRQSLIIIQDCLKNIPNGIIKIENYKIVFNLRSSLKSSMENVIHHFKICSEGFIVEENEIYTSVEAPKGEFGIYLVSNGSNKPYRCKIRPPGFIHLSGIDFLSKNHLIADVVTIIGTLDIVFGEIDR